VVHALGRHAPGGVPGDRLTACTRTHLTSPARSAPGLDESAR
jgi:hypothetical protein